MTLTGAVDQLYSEMASRHRARRSVVQIMRTAEIPASECRRVNTTQFIDSSICFKLPRTIVRANEARYRSNFRASRPNAYL